ncbi:MAG: hypothetical protein ACI9TH_001788, partial [Kiritimatiellia bacterium]
MKSPLSSSISAQCPRSVKRPRDPGIRLRIIDESLFYRIELQRSTEIGGDRTEVAGAARTMRRF